MSEKAGAEGQRDTITDEEFFAARREAMGEDYPGDEAMRQFDREADADFDKWVKEQHEGEASGSAAGAAAPAEKAAAQPDWNAKDYLRELFKDDPNFDKLSEADLAKLEALAEERREELVAEVQQWGSEQAAEWKQELSDSVKQGLESDPRLQEFLDTRLADGEMSDADKAALKDIAETMSPADAAGVVRPVVEATFEIHSELIDGVEMIVDEAIEDVQAIVDARAEMPGGDSPQVVKLQEQLEQAPEQVHDALDWEREQIQYAQQKADDRLELVEAGVDPKDLPPDTDTYQEDPNATSYDTEAA